MLVLAAAVVASGGLAGCQSRGEDKRVVEWVRAGEFGRARAAIVHQAESDPASRDFILDKMRITMLSLAEGVPEVGRPTAEDLYDWLRRQGLNADRTLATLVLGERGTRVYKGEPFEQAMAYHAIALFDALEGDWGNTRAAANDALFSLRDFSRAVRARTGRAGGDAASDRLALVQASARADRARSPAGSGAAGVDPEIGLPFDVRPSDFELGHVMKAIASRQLGNTDEVEEIERNLLAVAPRLADLFAIVRDGRYNVVLVVDAGLGPRKIATGPDGAVAAFEPRSRSLNPPLEVRWGDENLGRFPVVTDVNRLSRDVAWNNLEDVRRARSVIGDALLLGGAVTATAARDDGAKLAGAAAAALGMLLKATAAADTRFNDVMPQRVYVAPVWIPPGEPARPLTLISGAAMITLPGIAGPTREGEVVAFYARLPERSLGDTSVVRWSNDATGPAPAAGRAAFLPFILGGRCVRTPTEEVLEDYQRAGVLTDFSLEELIDLYREEGIEFPPGVRPHDLGRHVLEGGRALYTPRPGSVGFARLFGREHPAYSPRSDRVRALARELAARASVQGEVAGSGGEHSPLEGMAWRGQRPEPGPERS